MALNVGNIVKTIFRCLLLVISIVTTIVVVRTFTCDVRTIKKPECKPLDSDFIKADSKLIYRFQSALQFKTVSKSPGDARFKVELQRELLGLRDFIVKTYPAIHSSPLVNYEVVANYSLFYHVRGSDPSLKPFLLMGHLDVVPVEQDKWDVPAFDALIQDDFVYGRGTIDNKQTVFGILEAVEFLLKRGGKPKRSFYMAFGHDEEVSGKDGAGAIASKLRDKGLSFEFILDEGLTIIDGLTPGVDSPVALIGTSEKGYLTLKLSVTSSGGHSSMPEKESSIGILSSAIVRLESSPQPSMFGNGPEKDTFEHLAPYMRFPFRVLMTNLWLFAPLVSNFLALKPTTNALIRTTTSVTIFKAGIKSNVIPITAEAFVNHRVHPAQSLQHVIDYDRKIIDDDRVNIEVVEEVGPHPISPVEDDTFGYQTIKTSLHQVWKSKNIIVAPGLMIANTDTRHYLDLSENIYRFSPTYMYPEDLKRFHGNNERISIENYQEAVNFYYHVIMNADSESLEPKHEHGGEL